jgi:heavy metal translocating P-type ATPase
MTGLERRAEELPSPAIPVETSGVFASLRVSGMSCAGCASKIERAAAAVPGIAEAHVNFAAGMLSVRAELGDEGVAKVEAAVRALGFDVTLPKRSERADRATTEATNADDRELRDIAIRLAVAAFFAMTAMLPAIVVYLGAVDAGDRYALRALAAASGVLTVPVVFYSGWPFLSRAARSIAQRAPGMDLLVSSGALVAFSFSVVSLARGSSDVYFDTAGGIVTFLLVGRLLERLARKKSLGAVRLLQTLSPPMAHRIEAGGLVVDVATEVVPIGARVEVRPGERVPLDGVVVDGRSTVDRSLVTGESMPVAVAPDDLVEAGTLNQLGRIAIEVTRPVGARALDRIAGAVERLLARRAPTQALADGVAAKLTAIVIALALMVAVYFGWRGDASLAMTRAVSVLVVACPCALGLATPMAVVVAAGAAARRGILFRDAATIERAASVTAVLLDKTGTLTEGRPGVVDVVPARGRTREDVLATAALAERGSEHPIARAIVASAPPAPIEDGTITAVPGAGAVFAGTDGKDVRVGSRAFLESSGTSGIADPAASGTVAHVASDGVWIGAVVISDPLRAGAARAIESLRERGLRVEMVTGDRESAAEAIARAVGCLPFHAGQSPLHKARVVARLKRSREVVAFVGDGLNDGPALAAADVGAAVEGATDVASAAAGVVLRSGGVERLVEALDLAIATRRVMRQNVAWAVVYNAVALPAAIAGFVSPPLAALAMGASSLSVVLSSWRLARVVGP